MAFQQEKDLLCPICQDIFKDPVLLSCSHSFCKLCLRRWWKEKPLKECAVCRKRSLNRDPPSNLALKNLCESFVKKRRLDSAEDQCSVHSEKLKLFCLDHQQPVCVVCRDSKAHRDHRFSPIEEAAQDLKEELQKSLQPLKNKLQKVKGLKQKFHKRATRIRKQTRHTERQIKDQFKKLHQFLLEEEETRMKALREEEEQKTQRMKDKMAAVSREIEALSETILATEEQLRAADVSFLLKYKAAVDRVQHCPLLEEQQLGPGDLIDQAKHRGNLAFNIWSNMKRLVQYTPVVLNPNRGGGAVLSDDLTSLRQKEKQTDEPGTTGEDVTGVCGSEGFDSGAHSWDVEVGENDGWIIGVTTEDKEWCCIEFSNNKYVAGTFLKESNISLELNSNPRRIRVHVDCDKREATFYDADTNILIHSFSQIHQKKLFPFFLTCSKCPIRILPQEISLSINPQTVKVTE